MGAEFGGNKTQAFGCHCSDGSGYCSGYGSKWAYTGLDANLLTR